jgi:hypothetical protein
MIDVRSNWCWPVILRVTAPADPELVLAVSASATANTVERFPSWRPATIAHGLTAVRPGEVVQATLGIDHGPGGVSRALCGRAGVNHVGPVALWVDLGQQLLPFA